MTHEEQCAYDAGNGRRDISHHPANPYGPTTERAEWDAYNKGFADRDRELCAVKGARP